MANRHLDVTKSAALFSPISVVVEGITDALLLRAFGHRWAASDEHKSRFIDSVTITIAGGRIGDWIPRFLATRDFELVDGLVILGDADKLGTPSWLDDFDEQVVACFLSDPTLEPSLVAGNEQLVMAALKNIGADLGKLNPSTVAEYFAKEGPGSGKKADFAEAVVDLLETNGIEATAPVHFSDAFDFLWGRFVARNSGVSEDEEEADADEPTEAEC